MRRELLDRGKRLDAVRVLREIGHTQNTRQSFGCFTDIATLPRKIFSNAHQPLEAALCEVIAGSAYVDLGRFETADEKFASS